MKRSLILTLALLSWTTTLSVAQIDDDCALPDAGEQVAFAEEIASKTLAGPELVEWFPVTTETSINILIIPVQHGSFQHCVQVGASVNQDTG